MLILLPLLYSITKQEKNEIDSAAFRLKITWVSWRVWPPVSWNVEVTWRPSRVTSDTCEVI
jgi:hypothetical protein